MYVFEQLTGIPDSTKGRVCMNPQRIVGIIAIVTALMVGIGSNLPAMIDPPSAILVVGGVLAMLLIGRHNIGGMVSTVFSGSAPENQVKEAIQGYRMGRYYSMASGVMCLGVGITGMIKDVHDPASLGPGMAISLLARIIHA